MNPPDKDWPPIERAPENASMDSATKDTSHQTASGRIAEATSAGTSSLGKDRAEADPLLDQLRALPSLFPSDALTAQVARAALTELLAKSTTVPTVRPSEIQAAERAPGWRSYLEFALYRAALPSALAGATVIYLSWAISAASHLY